MAVHSHQDRPPRPGQTSPPVNRFRVLSDGYLIQKLTSLFWCPQTQQQRPWSPTVAVTRHVSIYKVRKLHHVYVHCSYPCAGRRLSYLLPCSNHRLINSTQALQATLRSRLWVVVQQGQTPVTQVHMPAQQKPLAGEEVSGHVCCYTLDSQHDNTYIISNARHCVLNSLPIPYWVLLCQIGLAHNNVT